MHGIRKDNLKEVIQSIIKSMGSTLAACGDVNRNVMAPAAPFETQEYITARNLAIKVADLLTPLAGQGTFLELWADGDLEYKIKPEKEIPGSKINKNSHTLDLEAQNLGTGEPGSRFPGSLTRAQLKGWMTDIGCRMQHRVVTSHARRQSLLITC